MRYSDYIAERYTANQVNGPLLVKLKYAYS